MRTLVRHAVLAASAAVVALACGSSNKQSREPSSSTENNQAQYNQPQQQPQALPQPTYDNNQQQQGSQDETAAGSTFGSGGPQKPFYGPGLTNPDDATGSATTNEGSMQAKQVTNLSDGDIFAIEDAANNGEIQMAELARKQGAGAQVKDFAAMMITHHRDAENKLKALAKKQNITSKDNDVSNKLKSDVSAMVSDLRSKKGKDFDRAYIDDQVKAHRDVLDIVDNQLIPSVQNTDLKSHLTDVRRTVADHLQKAEDIQSKMQPVGANEKTAAPSKAKTTAPAKAKGTNTPPAKPACDTSVDPDCDGDVHPAKDKNEPTKKF